MDDAYNLWSGTPPRKIAVAKRVTKLENEIKEMQEVIKIFWGKIIGRAYSTSRLSWKQIQKTVLYPSNGDPDVAARVLKDGTELPADFEAMLVRQMEALEKKIDGLQANVEALRKETPRSRGDSAYGETPGDGSGPSPGQEPGNISPPGTAKKFLPKKSFFSSPSINFRTSSPHRLEKQKTEILPGRSQNAFTFAKQRKITRALSFTDMDFDEIFPTDETNCLNFDQNASSPIAADALTAEHISQIPPARVTKVVEDSAKSSGPSNTNTSRSIVTSPKPELSEKISNDHTFLSNTIFSEKVDGSESRDSNAIERKKSNPRSVLSGRSESSSSKERSTRGNPVKTVGSESSSPNVSIMHKRKYPSSAVSNISSPSLRGRNSSKIGHKSPDLESTASNIRIKKEKQNSSSEMLNPTPSLSLGENSNSEIPHKSVALAPMVFGVSIKHKRKYPYPTLLNSLPSPILGKSSSCEIPHVRVDSESTTSNVSDEQGRRNSNLAKRTSTPNRYLGEKFENEVLHNSFGSASTASGVNITHKRKYLSCPMRYSSPKPSLVERYSPNIPHKPFVSETKTSDVIINHKRKNLSCAMLGSFRNPSLGERSITNSLAHSKLTEQDLTSDLKPATSNSKIKHKRRVLTFSKPNPPIAYKSLLSEYNGASHSGIPSAEEMFDNLVSSDTTTSKLVPSKASIGVCNLTENEDSNLTLIPSDYVPPKTSEVQPSIPSRKQISKIIQIATTSMFRSPSPKSDDESEHCSSESKQIKPSDETAPEENNAVSSRSNFASAKDSQIDARASQQDVPKEEDNESGDDNCLFFGESSDSSLF